MKSSGIAKRISLILALLIIFCCLSACGSKVSSDPGSAGSAGRPETSQQTRGLVAGDYEQETAGVVSNQERLDKEEQVLVYLEKVVPEVADFRRNIEDYNLDSNTKCRLIMRIDSVPDPKAADIYKRDYYYIYVGSDMGTHTSRWNSFYVKADLSEVLVEDATGGDPMTVEQWRKIKNK